jgi:hypothetical protein
VSRPAYSWENTSQAAGVIAQPHNYIVHTKEHLVKEKYPFYEHF